MKFLVSFITAMFLSFSALALDLINPWKGGSQGVELNQLLIAHLEKNNYKVKIVDVDHCRLVPKVWNQHNSPITINWSDSRECVAEAKHVSLISEAGQLFCSNKDFDINKKPIKIGWAASQPLVFLYESFDKKYGPTIRVPYLNSGQQIQGVIAGEIDIALLGQAAGLTSSLNCFLTTMPIKNKEINLFNFPEKEMYFSLIAVSYDDEKLKSIIDNFVKSNEINTWREKRSLTRKEVLDERKYFFSNALDRK